MHTLPAFFSYMHKKLQFFYKRENVKTSIRIWFNKKNFAPSLMEFFQVTLSIGNNFFYNGLTGALSLNMYDKYKCGFVIFHLKICQHFAKYYQNILLLPDQSHDKVLTVFGMQLKYTRILKQ